MSALYEAAFGLALGFSLTVPPGPMNALIAARSTRSFRRGFLTGLGAMSADLILGTAVFLLQSEIDLASIVRYIYAIGAVVMAFLAYRLLRARPSEVRVDPGELATYTSALAIGLSNPFQILWWLTAGLAFAYLGGLVLLAVLFVAIAIWIVAFPYSIRAGIQRYPRAEQWVTWGSGAIMLAFAIYFGILAI
jgi:threonine/homoserine/homoserine lactone efflux protein